MSESLFLNFHRPCRYLFTSKEEFSNAKIRHFWK
jgi:hypothetical protein